MALDKVVDSSALDAGMSLVADAIRAKAGTTDPLAWPDGFKAAVEGIQTGGGGGSSSASPKDVNFYDYDGTLVASYTLLEAQSLTALPDGPTHDGLTFQGWNCTLEKVKAFTYPMNVGAMYITDDGKTRLHIRIAAEGRMNVPLYISQTVANGVTIDWGDGSATETLVGTGSVNTMHTYANIGNYVITLDPVDGCTLGLGDGTGLYCVLSGVDDSSNAVYRNFLKSVQIGNGVTSISRNAFYDCYSLVSITIPDGVTSIDEYAFYDCYSLASIIIPDSVTSIGEAVFYYCYSLAIVTIPDSVTSIGNDAFYACYSLSSITISNCVTSIGSSVFSSCYSLASVAIQDGVTSFGVSMFSSCYSLPSITIPDGVTSIGIGTFSECYSLASITIPDSVTSIGGSAFYACYGMAEYHLKPTTPPTLPNKSAFRDIPSDCIIYVPAGCLEAYKNATNWATYASYMREEPA